MTQELSEEKKFVLSKAITHGKESWPELTLHEPAVVEVEQFYNRQKEKTPINAMTLLIGLMAGVPETVIQRLKYRDFMAMQEYALGFLNYTTAPETGKN